jgi:hypothetical protein
MFKRFFHHIHFRNSCVSGSTIDLGAHFLHGLCDEHPIAQIAKETLREPTGMHFGISQGSFKRIFLWLKPIIFSIFVWCICFFVCAIQLGGFFCTHCFIFESGIG